jgi:hypothetical protein
MSTFMLQWNEGINTKTSDVSKILLFYKIISRSTHFCQSCRCFCGRSPFQLLATSFARLPNCLVSLVVVTWTGGSHSISSKQLWWHISAYRDRWDTRTKFWSENLKGRDHSEDLGVDGRIIPEFFLGKCGGKVWTGCIRLRIGTSGGLLCEHCSEPSGSVRGTEFLD